MEPIRFYIKPEPKPRMTQRDKWAKRPAVVRYYDFCDGLRLLWGNRVVPDSVHLMFTIEMPASWSEKKKLMMEGQPHQQRPDIDNYIKAFLDALCKDDSYVYAVRAEKYWGRQASISVGSLQSTYSLLQSDTVTNGDLYDS